MDATPGSLLDPATLQPRASLRTSHTVLGVAFAARGSPMDLALRARLRRFNNRSRDCCRAIADRAWDGCPWRRMRRRLHPTRPAQRLKLRSVALGSRVGRGGSKAEGGRLRCGYSTRPGSRPSGPFAAVQKSFPRFLSRRSGDASDWFCRGRTDGDQQVEERTESAVPSKHLATRRTLRH